MFTMNNAHQLEAPMTSRFLQVRQDGGIQQVIQQHGGVPQIQIQHRDMLPQVPVSIKQEVAHQQAGAAIVQAAHHPAATVVHHQPQPQVQVPQHHHLITQNHQPIQHVIIQAIRTEPPPTVEVTTVPVTGALQLGGAGILQAPGQPVVVTTVGGQQVANLGTVAPVVENTAPAPVAAGVAQGASGGGGQRFNSWICKWGTCGKSFPKKALFVNHAMWHYKPVIWAKYGLQSGDKKCPVCEQSLAQMGCLLRHLVFSHKEHFYEILGQSEGSTAPRAPPMGSKAAKQQSATENKKWRCSKADCGKLFANKQFCLAHASLHFKPEIQAKYQMQSSDKTCPICNATLATHLTVIRHIVLSHKEHYAEASTYVQK